MIHLILHLFVPLFDFLLSRSRGSIGRLCAGAMIGMIFVNLIFLSETHHKEHPPALGDGTVAGGALGFFGVLALEWFDWSQTYRASIGETGRDITARKVGAVVLMIAIMSAAAIMLTMTLDFVLEQRHQLAPY